MRLVEDFDAITMDRLRDIGATKWQNDDGSIGAFIAEMDFGIAPAITHALHQAVDIGSFGYFPPKLSANLTGATAAWLESRFEWSVSPSDVHPIADVVRAYEFAIEHGCAPGRAVIVPTPAYKPFLLLPQMIDRHVIEVPMAVEGNKYVFDMAALQSAFDAGGELLVLCNPYNPAGRVFSRDELAALSELVARNNGRVFADEIWAPLTFAGHHHIPYASVSALSASHSITAISASKAWNMPGLKCAQVIVTNERDRETWAVEGPWLEHGASNLGAVATIAAYQDGDSWLSGVNAYLDRNRQGLATLIRDHLPGVGYEMPEGTYVGWLDFRQSAIAKQPAAFFKEKAGVILTEGTDCGAIGAGFTRLIFATPFPVMEEAISRMARAMRLAE
ncbi:MalY/PatB family protein [Sphingobium mellinum]|uniref:MalY/PatB family protein n=1 Tax=Sphingobium mellinum TaxID=1387166 RepID=UPI0030EC896D